MDMFFWFMIAIAVVAYLISNGKRKRKQEPYRRAPTKEQEYRDLELPPLKRTRLIYSQQRTSVFPW